MTTQTYTTLLPPGSVGSTAEGVSGGEVVGGSSVGMFLYESVPEPSGLVLLAIGLATTAGYLGLRQRTRPAKARPGILE